MEIALVKQILQRNLFTNQWKAK